MGRCIIVSSHSDKYLKEKISGYYKTLGLTSKNIADVLIIKQEKKQSIGIEDIKDLKEWSKVKPFSAKNKIALIKSADLLTEEAQNSLLKILEEPNDSLYILLTCSNYRKLLPTIISRCEIVADSKEKEGTKIDFLSLSVVDRILLVRKLVENKKKSKNWDEIKEFLTNLVYLYRENLLKNVRIKESSSNIRLIEETDKMLKANVLTKLALENLVLNLR